MHKIGMILFGIGLLIVSPLDDIIVLAPLSTVVGLWVFPVAIAIGILCLIAGGLILGRHFLPLLKKPTVLAFVIIGFIVALYCTYDMCIGYL